MANQKPSVGGQYTEEEYLRLKQTLGRYRQLKALLEIVRNPSSPPCPPTDMGTQRGKTPARSRRSNW